MWKIFSPWGLVDGSKEVFEEQRAIRYSETAVSISEESYPRASRRSRKEEVMEVKSEWKELARE
jgi:hypothetical protein